MLGDTLRQLDAALKMLESAQSIERIKTGRMRLFELLFDQDIGVNTSATQWHHRTLYTQKWSRPQLPFFCWKLLTPASTTILSDCAGALGQSWIQRRGMSYWSATTVVQHCGFHLEVNLHGRASQLRSVTVTELGDEVSSSVTAQNNKAICLNTEGVLGHVDSACL